MWRDYVAALHATPVMGMTEKKKDMFCFIDLILRSVANKYLLW